MNRLSHIQQTLVRNIEDNFLLGKVEFVLLDYNSSDGLEEWVRGLRKYIDLGILHYYRIDTPESYHRSHSRNVAFRLASGEIVCNLDADNFLGKGFAEYMIGRFAEAKEPMFITSGLNNRDIFGRVCTLRRDFMRLRGYNEIISGYGAEDTDLFKRLIESGLKQDVFQESEFSRVVSHSYNERISQEQIYRSLVAFYVCYETPFRYRLILLNNDSSCDVWRLINNSLCHFNTPKYYSNPLERDFDVTNRTAVEGDRQKGEWIKISDTVHLTIENTEFSFSFSDTRIRLCERDFYKVTNQEMLSIFIMVLSTAINFSEASRMIETHSEVNPNGFGQGTVYLNFDRTNPIILD